MPKLRFRIENTISFNRPCLRVAIRSTTVKPRLMRDAEPS